MNLTEKRCPVCSAPLTIAPDAGQARCPYCGTSFTVQRSGASVALNLADQVTDAVHESAFATRSELQRLQLTQELSTARLHLANVQREIRTLKRLPPSGTTKTQLAGLQRQETKLRARVDELDRELNPEAAAATSPPPATPREKIPWGWLLFSFRGRITRTLFWFGFPIAAVTYLFPFALLKLAGDPSGGLEWLAAPASILVIIGGWMLLAVIVKRFRDRGRAGWWALVAFIPIFGPIWLLVELGFLDSV